MDADADAAIEVGFDDGIEFQHQAIAPVGDELVLYPVEVAQRVQVVDAFVNIGSLHPADHLRREIGPDRVFGKLFGRIDAKLGKKDRVAARIHLGTAHLFARPLPLCQIAQGVHLIEGGLFPGQQNAVGIGEAGDAVAGQVGSNQNIDHALLLFAPLYRLKSTDLPQDIGNAFELGAVVIALPYIYSNDEIDPLGPDGPHRKIIDDAPVREQFSIDLNGRKQRRQRPAGPYHLWQIATLQDHLAPVLQIGGHRQKRNGQVAKIFDVVNVGRQSAQQIVHALSPGNGGR